MRCRKYSSGSLIPPPVLSQLGFLLWKPHEYVVRLMVMAGQLVCRDLDLLFFAVDPYTHSIVLVSGCTERVIIDLVEIG